MASQPANSRATEPPPDTMIPQLARRYLISSASVYAMTWLPVFIGGLSHFISLVAFIIYNVRVGYSDLSILGKISFYMWWIALVLPIIIVFQQQEDPSSGPGT